MPFDFIIDKSWFLCYITDSTDNTDDTEERGIAVAKYFSGKQDVYLEIADRYAQYIRLGVLREGDKLPSVRVAAGELGVNPNTVQRAYTYLEEQGIIQLLPKKGAFVTGSGHDKGEADASIIEILTQLKQNGVTKDALLQAVKEVYADD